MPKKVIKINTAINTISTAGVLGFLVGFLVSLSAWSQNQTTKQEKDLHKFEAEVLQSNPEVAYIIQSSQVDRIRHQMDRDLTRLFRNHPVAMLMDSIINEFAESNEVSYLDRLFKSSAVAMKNGEKSKGQYAQQRKIYERVLANPIYKFSESQRERAQMFIVGQNVVNAYAFTHNPYTVFYEGLVDKLSSSELTAVVAHELGHAQSEHVRLSSKLSALLMLAGSNFYQFDEGRFSADKLNLTDRASIRANLLTSNTFMPNLVDPSFYNRIASASLEEVLPNLEPVERSIVQDFLHHNPVGVQKAAVEQLKSYVDNIVDVASTTMLSTSPRLLEDLVLKVEELLIDGKEHTVSVKEAFRRYRLRQMPLSGMAKRGIGLREYALALSRGMLRLSRSKEQTADRYAVLVTGLKNSQSLFATMMGGKGSNAEAIRRQKELSDKLREENPERVTKARRLRASTHPEQLDRMFIAEDFVNSYRYKAVQDNFIASLESFFDLVIQSELLLYEQKSQILSATQVKKQFDQQEAVLKNRIDVMSGIIAEKGDNDAFNKTFVKTNRQSLEKIKLQKAHTLEDLEEVAEEISNERRLLLQALQLYELKILDVLVADIVNRRYRKVEKLMQAISEKVTDVKNVGMDPVFSTNGLVGRLAAILSAESGGKISAEKIESIIAGPVRSAAQNHRNDVLNQIQSDYESKVQQVRNSRASDREKKVMELNLKVSNVLTPKVIEVAVDQGSFKPAIASNLSEWRKIASELLPQPEANSSKKPKLRGSSTESRKKRASGNSCRGKFS